MTTPMTGTTLTAYSERWKQGMLEHIRDQRFSHALTLSWNADVALPVAREHLRLLHAKVDRKLFGVRFHEKPMAERSSAIFVLEGIGSHLHAHSLWRVRFAHMLRFNKLFSGNRGGLWNRIASSGSYELAFADDPLVFAGYALKGQHPRSDDREIIWSHEFVRS